MAGIQKAFVRLAEEGKQAFTVTELAELLGITQRTAQQTAVRMARAGLARRLKPGTYVLAPPDAWRDPAGLPGNWYVAAEALAGDEPHFLAYYTAMEIHRMTQHPLKTVFIAVTRQRKNIRAHGVTFRFVTVADHKFFGWTEHGIEFGQRIKVADLERTFVDCVDRFDLCGGLEEVFRGFARRHEELNADRLLRYLTELNEPALTKRLGFLLEAVGHGDPRLLWEIERVAGRAKRYEPLDVWRKEKPVQRNKRWELDINVDIERLLQAVET